MFGRRKVEPASLEFRVATLETEVARLVSKLRLQETEQMTLHDQVRKWMRRAVAAERRVEEPSEGAAPTAPLPPKVWGARGRRLMRGLAGRVMTVPAEGANGSDS